MAIEETQINQGLLDAALEISARRSQTLREIRDLYVAGKDGEAAELTKKFLNVHAAKTSRESRARSPRLALVKGK